MAIIGYRYLFDIFAGWVRGADELCELRVGDRTAWVGSVTDNTQIYVDAPDLFGGESGEGGVQGTLDVLFGGPTQEAPAAYRAQRGDDLPGFRGVVTSFFSGIVSMMNPYPKTWKGRWRRCFADWDGPVFEPQHAQIVLDSAPSNGSPLGGALRFNNTSHLTYSDITFNQTGSYEITGKFRLRQLIGQLTSIFFASSSWAVSLHDARLVELHIATALKESIPLSSENNGYFVKNVWYPFALQITVGAADGEGKRPTHFKITINDVVLLDSPYDYDWVGDGLTIGGGMNCWWDDVVVTNLTTSDVLLRLEAAGDHASVEIVDESGHARVPSANVGVTVDRNVTYGAGQVASYPLTDPSIYAVNAGHIVFECLTNRIWGRGLDRSQLDLPKWQAAIATLYTERFGLCVLWDRTGDIQEFAQGIIDTIAGAIQVDRSTGLVGLKLIRNDYVFEDLPLFDTDSGIVEITEAAVGSPDGLPNEIIVAYHDPITDGDKKVRAQNIAALQASGGVVNSKTHSYLGIPTAELAQRVAQRDLRALATPLRRFNITLDRRGWNVQPGDVIRIRDLQRQIPDMAVRVGQFDEGDFETGRIKIVAIQDVFSMPRAAYTSNVTSSWVPPNTRPCLGESRLIELPYAALARYTSPADFAYLTEEAGRFGVLQAEGQPLNISYDIAVKPGAIDPSEAASDAAYICGYTA